MKLKGRSFLSLMDFTKDEIRMLLDLSHELKREKQRGETKKRLHGKNIAIIFEKTSTRTRCAFEVGAFDEGANVTYLTNSQMGKKESIEDTAKVLGRFYDGIEFRGYKQETVEMLSKYSDIPVWNGLTDRDHPTQVLADFMTLEEKIDKPLEDIKLVYIGDARNNTCYSLMYGCAKMGLKFTIIAPQELWPEKEALMSIEKIARDSGAEIKVSDNLEEVKAADAMYTDIWASMGEEDKMLERVEILAPYRITMDLIIKTENPLVVFMHCLPSYHDFNTAVAREYKDKYNIDIREVTDEVFRSSHSVVFDEAENRLHTIKAVMVATLC